MKSNNHRPSREPPPPLSPNTNVFPSRSFQLLIISLFLWLVMMMSPFVNGNSKVSERSSSSDNSVTMTTEFNFSCKAFSNVTVQVGNETSWELVFNQTLSNLNCMNGGFCEMDGNTCNCTFTNYTGQNCSIPRNDNSGPCKEGENCVFGKCVDHTCQCDANVYTMNFDESQNIVYCNAKYCPNNCTDATHGICNATTGTCHCLENYFGANCSFMECRNCIPGRGKCDYLTGTCNCISPYFGEGCSQTQCPDPSCRGVGRCNHEVGICECDADHFGVSCEFSFCKNNCSNHGTCNTTSSVCTCVGGWTGSDCSINSHVLEMKNIKASVRVIGTIFVFLVPIALIVSSYVGKIAQFDGYLFLIFEIFQFIGLTSLMGTNSPPVYLKFSSFFQWSNFLFNTEDHMDISVLSPVQPVVLSSALEEERILLYKYIDISFIDNFVLITTSVAIVIMISVFIILVKVIRGKYTQYNNEEVEKMKDRIFTCMIRMALLFYSGISLSTFFQIKVTMMMRAAIVTLFTALSILFAFVLGFPFIASVVLKANRDKINKEVDDKISESPFTPLHNDFKSSTYQYLLIILIKKCIFSFVIGFFEGLELMIALLCIQSAYFMIVMIIRPYKSAGRNTLQIIVEGIVLLNMVALVIFYALSFNSYFSILIAVVIIICHCGSIMLAIGICIYEKYRQSNAVTQHEYHSNLLDEDELEIQGTHTIFDDSDDDQQAFRHGAHEPMEPNHGIDADFHDVDLMERK